MAHENRTNQTLKIQKPVWHVQNAYNYAERQIAAAGCRTRTDSVRLVEVLITASPEFFEGKSSAFARAFFERSLDFIKSKQREETIISAVATKH